MDFETKLKYLDVMYCSKEMKYSLEINKPIDYRSLFYIELKVLLDKYLLNGDDIEKNYQVFLDNLDIILRYTNESNMEWIYYDFLYKDDRFIEAFSNHIDSIRFKHHVCFIVARICNAMSEYRNCKDLLNDRVLDYIMRLPYPFAVNTLGLVFDKLDDDGIINFLKKALKYKKLIDFSRMNSEKFSSKVLSFIYDNALDLAKISYNILSLKEIIMNDSDALERVDMYYKNHSAELALKVLNTLKVNDLSDSLCEILLYIFNEIIINEDATFSDISWKLGGSYSDLIYIKNKVFKYGFERAVWKFHNNPYIVKPLLRKSFDDLGRTLYVEVIEKEKTRPVTEEEMYLLYKRFRDLNLIWSDVKSENVGELLKDNIIYWKKNLEPCDEALELGEFRGSEVLKKGDIVLLDADHIYDLDDEDISHNRTKYFDDFFEKRYQDELNLIKGRGF